MNCVSVIVAITQYLIMIECLDSIRNDVQLFIDDVNDNEDNRRAIVSWDANRRKNLQRKLTK